jgi:hypothetical protein
MNIIINKNSSIFDILLSYSSLKFNFDHNTIIQIEEIEKHSKFDQEYQVNEQNYKYTIEDIKKCILQENLQKIDNYLDGLDKNQITADDLRLVVENLPSNLVSKIINKADKKLLNSSNVIDNILNRLISKYCDMEGLNNFNTLIDAGYNIHQPFYLYKDCIQPEVIYNSDKNNKNKIKVNLKMLEEKTAINLLDRLLQIYEELDIEATKEKQLILLKAILKTISSDPHILRAINKDRYDEVFASLSIDVVINALMDKNETNINKQYIQAVKSAYYLDYLTQSAFCFGYEYTELIKTQNGYKEFKDIFKNCKTLENVYITATLEFQKKNTLLDKFPIALLINEMQPSLEVFDDKLLIYLIENHYIDPFLHDKKYTKYSLIDYAIHFNSTQLLEKYLEHDNNVQLAPKNSMNALSSYITKGNINEDFLQILAHCPKMRLDFSIALQSNMEHEFLNVVKNSGRDVDLLINYDNIKKILTKGVFNFKIATELLIILEKQNKVISKEQFTEIFYIARDLHSDEIITYGKRNSLIDKEEMLKRLYDLNRIELFPICINLLLKHNFIEFEDIKDSFTLNALKETRNNDELLSQALQENKVSSLIDDIINLNANFKENDLDKISALKNKNTFLELAIKNYITLSKVVELEKNNYIIDDQSFKSFGSSITQTYDHESKQNINYKYSKMIEDQKKLSIIHK